jgi:hypothetical protein
MGGCDSYVGHYWEYYFEENIHYSEECDHVDSIYSIDSIVYHDTDGSKYSVNVEVHPIIFKLFDWYNWNVVLKISILLDSTRNYIKGIRNGTRSKC